MSSALRSSDQPACLSDLIGQARATAVLRNAIRRDRVAHAYLFRGPEGVGKATAALLFAQALVCEQVEHGDPCGRCRSCQLCAEGNHPDVRLITFEVDEKRRTKTEISIHQIRQDPDGPHVTPRPLVQDAVLRPLLGQRKVYIIDPAHRMSQAAANAMLKVLEEPPPYAVLILVSSQPDSLLPTVLSRCQQVTFQLAGSAAVESHLQSLGLSPAEAASLAALSGGRVGWAVSASRRPEVLEVRRALLDLCASLPGMTLPRSLRLAEEIREQATKLAQARAEEGGEEEEEGPASEAAGGADRSLRAALPWCLEVMALWFRDCLAAAQGGGLVNPDYAEAIQTSLPARSATADGAAIEALLAARLEIQRNANLDLTLEAVAMGLLSEGEVVPHARRE